MVALADQQMFVTSHDHDTKDGLESKDVEVSGRTIK